MTSIIINEHDIEMESNDINRIFGTNEHNFADRYDFTIDGKMSESNCEILIECLIKNSFVELQDKLLSRVISFIHIHTNTDLDTKMHLVKRLAKYMKYNNIELNEETRLIIDHIINEISENINDKDKFTYYTENGSIRKIFGIMELSKLVVNYSDFVLCTSESTIIDNLQTMFLGTPTEFLDVLATLEFIFIYLKKINGVIINDFGNVTCLDGASDIPNSELIDLYPKDHPVIKAFKKFNNNGLHTTPVQIMNFYSSLE
jgi:hypothetical protein